MVDACDASDMRFLNLHSERLVFQISELVFQLPTLVRLISQLGYRLGVEIGSVTDLMSRLPTQM